MQKEIQSYYDVRTANALDLTVEQVQTVNRLEERHNADLASEDAESIRLTGSSAYLQDHQRRFEVTIDCGRLFVEWREEGFRWNGEVLKNGTVKTER